VRLTEVNTLTSNSRFAVEIKLRHTLTPPILWRRVFAGFLEHSGDLAASLMAPGTLTRGLSHAALQKNS
jgi:hypothetical protein